MTVKLSGNKLAYETRGSMANPVGETSNSSITKGVSLCIPYAVLLIAAPPRFWPVLVARMFRDVEFPESVPNPLENLLMCQLVIVDIWHEPSLCGIHV